MPSWKKLITSGSDAALSSLTLTTGSLALDVRGGSVTVSGSFIVTGSINSSTRVLYDSAGYQSVNYNTRNFFDEAGALSINFGDTAGDIVFHKNINYFYIHSGQEGDILTVADSKLVTVDKSNPFILIDLTQYTRFNGLGGQLYNTYYQYTYTVTTDDVTSPSWLQIGFIEVFKHGNNLYFSSSIKTEQGTLPGGTAFGFDQGSTTEPTKLYFTTDSSAENVQVKYKVLVM